MSRVGTRVALRRTLGGVTLLLPLCAGSAAARPPATGAPIDAAACAQAPRAASLITSAYLTLPTKHTARSLPAAEVRRLFDAGSEKAKLVRKSLAEEYPVLVTMRTPGSATGAPKLWKAAPGSHDDACGGTMVVVGYDDVSYGGAFEAMSACATDRDAGFFWVRYDDFNRFAGCALEVVGRRGGDTGTLSGSVRFEEASGRAMRAQRAGRVHQLERAYPSGTRFRIVVTAKGPAYVYVVASDLTEQLYPLFPDKDGSALLPYGETDLAVPSGAEYLHLDNRPGTDFFLVLYSTRPLDFTGLVRRMQDATGDLGARLQTVAARDVMQDADVEFTAAEQIDFSGRSATRSVLPVLVELRHLQ